VSVDGERVADALSELLAGQLTRLRGELAEAAQRAGLAGLLAVVAGGCALLVLSAGSGWVTRLTRLVLARRC
jgi:hypothetical protein